MALVRAILDRSPVGLAEPVSTAKTHRLMLAADRASARIAKWEKQPEPDPRPIAFWPADFVKGDQWTLEEAKAIAEKYLAMQ